MLADWLELLCWLHHAIDGVDDLLLISLGYDEGDSYDLRVACTTWTAVVAMLLALLPLLAVIAAAFVVSVAPMTAVASWKAV